MNQTTLTIITIAANAIITGIIVYTIQKKIENALAKRMEEFKINLQYSLFEQQTKFKRIHEKRVETLETLYQKFTVFRLELVRILYDAVSACKLSGNQLTINDKEIKECTKKLDDFNHYFINSRLYLPYE